jgi:hypothetical protein
MQTPVFEETYPGGYLTQDTAGEWLDHLATQPFFASTTLFITTATAA